MKMFNALFALFVVGFCFAGLSISGYTLSPEVVEPGTSGFLQITVENTGAQEASVQNVLIEVSSVEGLGIDRSFSVGDLESGASVIVSVPFSASEEMKSGFYTIDVDATGIATEYYLTTNGETSSKTETFQKSASIPVQVVDQPILSVSLSDESLEDLTPEKITITNTGGAAKRIEVKILNEGVGFLNTGKLYVESMNGKAEAETTLDARGAEEGAAKLQFELTYQNELGTRSTEVIEVPVTIKKSEGNFAFAQKEPIVTGENEELLLSLKNSGNAISDLRFTFGTEEAYLIGMNEYVVGDVAAGETKALSVPMKVNLAPGTQNIALELSWEESGENRVATVNIPVEVISNANVGVYLEAESAPLSAGSTNSLSVTISNLGSYDIQGTTVRLESEAFTLETIQPEQFIGELESDDFSSVQYDITMNNVQGGEYNATVVVSFRDASGKWMEVERNIPITVSGRVMSAETQRSSGLNYIAIAGTVVVGGAAYLAWKKWKGGKKQGAGGIEQVRK